MTVTKTGLSRGAARPDTVWKLVVMESPYGGKTPEIVERNVTYARACLRDCLARMESPIASHLLLTQPGVLDDTDKYQRRMGLLAGNAWIKVTDAVVVYNDLGITQGMWDGIKAGEAHGRTIIYRTLYGDNRRDVRDSAETASDQS